MTRLYELTPEQVAVIRTALYHYATDAHHLVEQLRQTAYGVDVRPILAAARLAGDVANDLGGLPKRVTLEAKQ